MRQSQIQARLIDLEQLIAGESTNTQFLEYIEEFDQLLDSEDIEHIEDIEDN